jgi:hypothetical protein
MALTQTAGITISDVPCTLRLLRVKTRSWSFCWLQKPILMSQIDGGAPPCKTPFQVGRIHARISSDPEVTCFPVFANHTITNDLCAEPFMHPGGCPPPPHSCMCPSDAGAGRCSLARTPCTCSFGADACRCSPADCRFCLDP